MSNGYAVNPNVSGHQVSVGENTFQGKYRSTYPYTLGTEIGGKIDVPGNVFAAVNMEGGNLWRHPEINGDMLFDAVSNGELRARFKGTDGVVRQAS